MFFFLFKIASKTLQLIIDANLSFNVVTQPAYQELLESISGCKLKIPSRQKLVSTLEKESQSIKEALIKQLKDQRYLCATADVWSSHAQSYLGVTIHFLNKGHERESYLLAFKQMKNRQTYDVLAEALDSIFKEYEIDVSKITHIVTDGGSSFCKLFKQYGDQIDAVVLTRSDESTSDDVSDREDASDENDEEDEIIM